MRYRRRRPSAVRYVQVTASGLAIGHTEPLNRPAVPAPQIAATIIRRAERSLGRSLSTGERRDLLTDNTNWPRPFIFAAVAGLLPSHATV